MWSDLRYRLRALFRRDAMERDLDREFQFHLDQQIATDLRAGFSRAEAERRARLQFGGIDQLKETDRDGRGISPIEIVARDRAEPRFTTRCPAFRKMSPTRGLVAARWFATNRKSLGTAASSTTESRKLE